MTSHWLLKTATGALAVSLLAATLLPATSFARGTNGASDGASGGTGGGRGTDGGSSSSGGAASGAGGGTGGGDAGRGNGDSERFPPRYVPPRLIVLDQRLRPDCVSRRVMDDWGYAALRRSCVRARFGGWN